LVQSQTRHYDGDAAPGPEAVNVENGGRDECEKYCDGHKDKDFVAQACGCSNEQADSEQNSS
jgi:hypothetical protein